MLDRFADELRLAREQKGLSLQQVALKTKIDSKFLEVMEEGDFSFLPEIYVKAFLKNYAKVVGLDEEITVRKYESAKAGRYENTELPPAESEPKPPRPKETVRHIRTAPVSEPKPLKEPVSDDKRKYIFGAAALVLLIVALMYYLFSDSGNQAIVTEKPLEEVVQENQQRYLEQEKSPEDNGPFTGSSDSLNLNIVSSETSWVKIVYDDRNTGEFLLLPMSQKNIKALNNFKITFGNSKGIKLKLNGNELKFDASRQVVTRIMIDSTGLRPLNTQPNVQR